MKQTNESRSIGWVVSEVPTCHWWSLYPVREVQVDTSLVLQSAKDWSSFFSHTPAQFQ